MVQTRKKNNNKKTRQHRKRKTNRGGMFRPIVSKAARHGLSRALSRTLSDIIIPSQTIDPDLYALFKDKSLIEKLHKIATTHTHPPSIPKTEKELLKSLEEKIKRELEPMFPDQKIESINLNNITVANIDKHHKLGMKNIASMAISGIEKQIQVEYETFKTEGTYEPTSINFKTFDAKVALLDLEVDKIKILCQQVRIRISHGESIHSAVMWGMYQAKDYKTIYYTLKWYFIMIIAVIAALKEVNDKMCKTESNVNNKNNCTLITSLNKNLERAIKNPAKIEDPTIDQFPNNISIGELYQALNEVIKPEYEQILSQPFFSKTPTSGLFPQYDPNTNTFV
jgi:hypothetical protein